MSKKGKKTSASATNGKAHKNGKANGKSTENGKHPEAESVSAPMQTALDAVATMPVGKTSKLEAIVALLKRPEGATIDDMVAATGWQKHTVSLSTQTASCSPKRLSSMSTALSSQRQILMTQAL